MHMFMFYLAIETKYNVTVTLGWHDSRSSPFSKVCLLFHALFLTDMTDTFTPTLVDEAWRNETEYTTSMIVNDTTSAQSNSTIFDDLVNTTAASRGTTLKNYLEYEISKTAIWLFFNNWKIISPPGILGNFIVLVVTLRMKPFNSSSLFMVSLAAVDMFLVCGRIPFKEVALENDASCMSLWYIFNVLPVYSNYILLLWTVERLIAVQFPLRVNDWCTLRNTAIAVVGAGIFSALFCVPWGLSQINFVGTPYCTLDKEWREFMYNIWFYVDTTIFAFIPMVAIFFCNILIIIRLKQSTERHKKMTSSEEARKNREREQRNMTITLLTVSFTFLILHVPTVTYQIASFIRFESTPEEKANWLFLNAMASTFMELQNSVNFYLYFLSGRRYREQTLKMILICRSRPAKDAHTEKSTGVTNMAMSVSETASSSNNVD